MVDKNTLDVYANEPIQLENIALGYDITFKMEEFDYNFSNKVVVYNGYAFFKDLVKEIRYEAGNGGKGDWKYILGHCCILCGPFL